MAGRVVERRRDPRRSYTGSDIVRWLTREDCPNCWAERDDEGRLPIGYCDPVLCLMARIRRGEVLPYVVVG